MNKIFLHITLTMILLSCISCADRDSSKHSSGSRNAIRFDVADISLPRNPMMRISRKSISCILARHWTLQMTKPSEYMAIWPTTVPMTSLPMETGRASTSLTSARCKFQTLTYRRINCTGSKTIRQKTPNTIKAQT